MAKAAFSGELIDHFDRTGSSTQQWTTIRTLIETLTRLGRDEPAAVLHGALSASPTAPPVVGADVTRMAEALATLRKRLGDDRFFQLEAQGVALGYELTIAYALKHARA